MGRFVLLMLVTLLPVVSLADGARDGTVNPGNASYLGPADPPSEEAEKQAELTAELKPEAPETEAEETEGQSGTLEFYGPLAVVNQHPPQTLFLAPVPETAEVLAAGESFLNFKVDWTNVMIRERDSGIIVDFDFETMRLTADYHRGMWGGEVSARVPYIARFHGLMDPIIADWHKMFDLNNGLRDTYPGGMYRYVIATRDGFTYNDAGDTSGFGDVALGYKYPLWNANDSRNAAALRAGIKLPTGDPDKALGSGALDFSIGGTYQRQLAPKWRAYANLDYIFIGNPEWEVAHQDTPVALVAVEYALKPGTTFLAQYRLHRNPLIFGSYEADKDAQELALGFHRDLGGGMVLSGGFNEDLNPETSPDFTLTTQLQIEF